MNGQARRSGCADRRIEGVDGQLARAEDVVNVESWRLDLKNELTANEMVSLADEEK